MISLEKLLDPLKEGIYATGKFIQQESKSFDPSKIQYKAKNDLVSYVDQTADKMLKEHCSALIKDSGFINEESGIQVSGNDYTWIIDPLDGTTNFIHGIPAFCVSVALQYKKEIVTGCVYEVNREEFFHAVKGMGAFLNDKPIKVSATPILSKSLIATGFPYSSFHNVDNYLGILKDFLDKTHGLRRVGSAAMDLAYTACGRFEGFFETHLKPWDVAAGILLIQEAGGKITDFDSGDNFIFGNHIVASNGLIHEEMLEVIRAHDFIA